MFSRKISEFGCWRKERNKLIISKENLSRCRKKKKEKNGCFHGRMNLDVPKKKKRIGCFHEKFILGIAEKRKKMIDCFYGKKSIGA